MPLRRLNHREFNNTVRDLLGVTSNPADSFPLDVDGGFAFHRAGLVSTLDASVLRDAAEAMVKTLDIAKLLTCSPSGGEDACAATFIKDFGAKAYRRPVSAEETTRLTALFKAARTTLMLDFNESIRVVVEAIVQSPGFLYRWELGNTAATLEGAVAKLTPYEVASRLSYFFWRSMPWLAVTWAPLAHALGARPLSLTEWAMVTALAVVPGILGQVTKIAASPTRRYRATS